MFRCKIINSSDHRSEDKSKDRVNNRRDSDHQKSADQRLRHVYASLFGRSSSINDADDSHKKPGDNSNRQMQQREKLTAGFDAETLDFDLVGHLTSPQTPAGRCYN